MADGEGPDAFPHRAGGRMGHRVRLPEGREFCR
jgi:hypothetical protein